MGPYFLILQRLVLGLLCGTIVGRPSWQQVLRRKMFQNLETLESLAIFKGLQQCIHLGLSKIIIESDCQQVVNEILSPKASHSLLGNFFFFFLYQSLNGYVLALYDPVQSQIMQQYCPQISKHAWNVNHIMLWLGEAPEFVAQYCWLDKRLCIPSVLE